MQSNIEVARARNALPGTCTICGSLAVFIIESRPLPNGGRRRRKRCDRCGHRETTYEITAQEYKALRGRGKPKPAPVSTESCEQCIHWETTSCGLGFPEAGGKFAADCSCFIRQESQESQESQATSPAMESQVVC